MSILEAQGIHNPHAIHNPSTAVLYENALRWERGTAVSATGALIALSGEKTGRSPGDKRVVRAPQSEADVWWGDVNIELEERAFQINRERAVDYLDTRERLYVVDGFAGWDPEFRIKVRVVCERAYHALFMKNMLIRPTAEEHAAFGTPDYTIWNAGRFPANRFTSGMTSKTSVSLSFEKREMVILGTEYAGEMKKGVFTIMNYLMPKRDILSMHCSANEGPDGDVTIFFGLSGTGKTTLSADPHRRLIGDDEHAWSDRGVFNVEGGCYAKVIDLSAEDEPEIHQAIRFGAILENVDYDPHSHAVDYTSSRITQNTRCSYPIEFIDNAKIPCVGGHPRNVILLTCDAFSVLPPVSRLTPEQAMYHFISGYTAKVAGTEMGIKEPEATFSACFGAPFLVWHPMKYAALLADRMRAHGVRAWLVNTGWTGGPYGVGKRMSIQHTRSIIDAIHSGELADAPTEADPVFGFAVPTRCPNVPDAVLRPKSAWADPAAFDEAARRLATRFGENFEQYRAGVTPEVLAAGPKV